MICCVIRREGRVRERGESTTITIAATATAACYYESLGISSSSNSIASYRFKGGSLFPGTSLQVAASVYWVLRTLYTEECESVGRASPCPPVFSERASGYCVGTVPTSPNCSGIHGCAPFAFTQE